MRLLVPLALAAFLLAAPQAQAFTCGPTAHTPPSGEFFDCSGTANFVGSGGVDHDTTIDGGFVPDDWFTDLHLTFTDPGATVNLSASGFFNITDQVAWIVSSSAPNQISFTAPNNAARVDGGTGGDDYDWNALVTGGLNPLSFTIEYTMDVPEPGLALLLAPALFGLCAAGRRRSG